MRGGPRSRCVIRWAWIIALGCGPSQPSDTGSVAATGTDASGPSTRASASGDASGGTDDEVVGDRDCGCARPDEVACDYDALADLVPGCEMQPAACPVLTIGCARPNANLYTCKDDLVYDDEALTCMLEALRDRTPAFLHLEGIPDCQSALGGCELTRYLYRLHDDGRVVISGCSVWSHAGESAQSSHVAQAAPADHFAGCAMLPTSPMRYSCMQSGLPREPLPDCP